jgi:cytochrome c2
MRGVVVVVALAAALTACKRTNRDAGPAVTATALHGDASRGRDLVTRFECTRCHTVEGVQDPPKEKRCTGCHHDIQTGAVTATPAQKARWQAKVAELGDVPTLVSTGTRLRRGWIADFLLHPRDLRPLLQPTMPGLALTPQQALDIATFLAPVDEPGGDDSSAALAGADPARGRELMEAKGCGLCHRITGAPAIVGAVLPVGVVPADLPRAMRLAPDLAGTRDRWRAAPLIRWLANPVQVKPDTLMPVIPLTEIEAKSVAAYVLRVPLKPVDRPALPVRLGVLDRKVTYDEVATRVFRKTCWHCHGEPDFERGDGGPGNSGGFGFKGRGLNLSEYASTFAGYLDDTGKRTSVFVPGKDGVPFIVEAMLARQSEERGDEPALRGMPLGLPALPPADVQLVDTWIAQGRPR